MIYYLKMKFILLHGVDDVEEEVGGSDSDASTLEYDFSQDRIVRGICLRLK